MKLLDEDGSISEERYISTDNAEWTRMFWRIYHRDDE